MTTIPNQHEAPYETLDWVREGTAVLLAQLDRLSDDEFGAASLLPGWRRTHVLAHLSRDADALGNLLTWAATGVPTPMYSSFEQRNLDIEAGAIQSAAWLREDLRRSCDRVTWQLDTMPATPGTPTCVPCSATRSLPPGCHGCAPASCGCT